MRKAYLDWETKSEIDLKVSGMFRYAEDPSTDPLIAAFCIGSGPVLGVDLSNYEEDWELIIRLMSPLFDHIEGGGQVVAHNAQFERVIWEKTPCAGFGTCCML